MQCIYNSIIKMYHGCASWKGGSADAPSISLQSKRNLFSVLKTAIVKIVPIICEMSLIKTKTFYIIE